RHSRARDGEQESIRPRFARHRRSLVDRLYPVLVLRILAAHNIKEDLAQFADYWPHLPSAKFAMVDRSDGGDLDARTAQKGFLRAVNLGAINGTLNDL